MTFRSPAPNSGWPWLVATLRVSSRTRVEMRAVVSVQEMDSPGKPR